MGEQSTKSKRANADLLPYPDFPLSVHTRTGRWFKKIGTTFHYFGRVADGWEPALAEYERVREDIHRNLPRRPKVGGAEVKEVANSFIEARSAKVKTGELRASTLKEYIRVGQLLADTLGSRRAVADLRPADFTALRAKLAEGLGPAELGKRIGIVRSIFKHAHESEIAPLPSFGPEFKKPKREHARRVQQAKPKRLLSADEIRALLKIASPQMKAMILLAVNAGMGNADVANLPLSAVDLDAGILDYPRSKTAIERRATLWPETVKAIRAALKVRPMHKDENDAGCVFVTKYGRRWARFKPKLAGEGAIIGGAWIDSVALEFGKMLRTIGAKRAGVQFYALRHVFETEAGSTRDQAAIDRIMGHSSGSMAERYTEWRSDAAENARLKAVTDHVRKWLFKKMPKCAK